MFFETTYTQFSLLFSQDVETLRTWLLICFQGRILPFETIQKLDSIDNIVLTEVGFNFFSFENLSGHEQAVLLKSNVGKVVALLLTVFNDVNFAQDFFDSFVQFGLKNNELTGVGKLIPVLQEIGTSPKSKFDGYRAIFASPWAAHSDIEKKHFEITKSILNWTKSSRDERPDSFQLLLVTMIIFLSCEDTSFVGAQKLKVEKLQLKYVLLLQRYLKNVCPREANSKFTGGLMILHYAKELANMHSLRLPF